MINIINKSEKNTEDDKRMHQFFLSIDVFDEISDRKTGSGIQYFDIFLEKIKPIEYEGELFRARLVDFKKDLGKNKGFEQSGHYVYGYNEIESGRPPEIICKAGRMNSEWQSYWYFADDPVTAMMEVQPTIRQGVSLAKYRTKHKVKIIDFSIYKNTKWENMFDEKIIEKYGDNLKRAYEKIVWFFSKPYEESKDYYISNLIRERCQELGTSDGIKYKSFYGNGNNIVVWNTDKEFEWIDSKLYMNYCCNNYFLSLSDEENLDNNRGFGSKVNSITQEDINVMKGRVLDQNKTINNKSD